MFMFYYQHSQREIGPSLKPISRHAVTHLGQLPPLEAVRTDSGTVQTVNAPVIWRVTRPGSGSATAADQLRRGSWALKRSCLCRHHRLVPVGVHEGGRSWRGVCQDGMLGYARIEGGSPGLYSCAVEASW